MDQTEAAAFSIGEVIDALGVKLPTVDETPAAPEAEQEIDPAAQTDTTQTDETESEESSEDSPDPSDPSDESESTDESAADDETEESDPDAETTEEAAPTAVKKLTKRVDKLTARAKSAEEQAATLQAELAAARAALTKAQPIVLQDTSDPLADVTTAEALEGRIAAANTVLDNVPDLIAKADMEGEVEVPMGDGSTRKFTKNELQDRLRVARQILKAEPARRQYLAQRETYQHEARAAYPELFQEDSQARQMMLATLRAYPAIAKLPNLELIVGDAIRGQAVRFQQAEATAKARATKPAAKAAPAKPAVAPKVVSPSAAPKTKTKADPLEVLKKSGNRDAAENFVASLFN
jgi:hypothetical protein